MFYSGIHQVYGNQANIRAAEKALERKKDRVSIEKEVQGEARSAVEKTEKTEADPLLAEQVSGNRNDRKEDSIEISPEGKKAAEETKEAQETAAAAAEETESEVTSEKTGGKVAVNEGKRRRQIAAAKTQAQVQQVLSLLQKDLADCKAGLEKGWCDESEIAKVEALINQAKERMSQVPQKAEQEEGGLDEFAMASLM